MKHELWVDPDGLDTFCLAEAEGDAARALLPEESSLEWTVEAASPFEAMTKYYEYRGYGTYTTDFPGEDNKPYESPDPHDL
jgi:hypothetical protein